MAAERAPGASLGRSPSAPAAAAAANMAGAGAGAEEAPSAYGLRKRRCVANAGPPPLEALLAAAVAARSIVVFTGSGLSAASGMSTFSTPGGLYERAARAYALADGKALFTHAFFARRRADALAFLADVHAEAAAARPAPAHAALADLAATGALRRHYTLNVDGLAAAAGLSTWSPAAPGGATVEMHGSVRELVCAACGAAAPATPAAVAAMRAREVVPCGACAAGEGLRFRLMLYDDADAEHISPDAVLDALDEDVAAADLILWVGISFQQSASTAYFRRVRARARPGVPQAIVNPSEDARWNLLTACSNQQELELIEVLAPADEAVAAVARVAGRAAAVAAAAAAVPPPAAPPVPAPLSADSFSPAESG